MHTSGRVENEYDRVLSRITVPLLGRLRHDVQIGACGTARPKSKGFPTDFRALVSLLAKPLVTECYREVGIE
jgi:hypothetical protein